MIENRLTPATENHEEPWLCPEISVKVVGDAQARAKSPAKKSMNGGVHGFNKTPSQQPAVVPTTGLTNRVR